MKALLGCLLLWTISVQLQAQRLFPGDTNNDGVANFLDLLPVAQAYGTTGPERTGAMIEWMGQEALVWRTSLPISEIDHSFVDCDGNGIIDSLDLDAIDLNYDSLQITAIPAPTPYFLSDTLLVPTLPEIRLAFDRDTVSEGDTVGLTIEYWVPEDFPPTAGALALALALEFDESFIKDSITSFVPNADNTDLMLIAAATNFQGLFRAPGPGRIEMAAGGRGEPALGQRRMLGQLNFVIEDMILGLQDERPFWINPKDFLLINQEEQVIELGFELDTLLVRKFLDKTVELQFDPEDFLKVFPNPSADVFHLEFKDYSTAQFKLYNLQGQTVYKESVWQIKNFQFDLSYLNPGIYFLEIFNGFSYWKRRLVKIP